ADYLICGNSMPGDGFRARIGAHSLRHSASSLGFPLASCGLCDKMHPVERSQIVIRVVHRTVGELSLLLRHPFVGNEAEEMADTVEARSPFIVGADDAPGCEVCVGCREHSVARSRVFEPLTSRAQICRAKLPLAQRILDAGQETALLLLLTNLQPVFDHPNAAIDNEQLELRADLEKAPVLLVCAEAHHVLD